MRWLPNATWVYERTAAAGGATVQLSSPVSFQWRCAEAAVTAGVLRAEQEVSQPSAPRCPPWLDRHRKHAQRYTHVQNPSVVVCMNTWTHTYENNGTSRFVRADNYWFAGWNIFWIRWRLIPPFTPLFCPFLFLQRLSCCQLLLCLTYSNLFKSVLFNSFTLCIGTTRLCYVLVCFTLVCLASVVHSEINLTTFVFSLFLSVCAAGGWDARWADRV